MLVRSSKKSKTGEEQFVEDPSKEHDEKEVELKGTIKRVYEDVEYSMQIPIIVFLRHHQGRTRAQNAKTKRRRNTKSKGTEGKRRKTGKSTNKTGQRDDRV